ncbi:unnamed protein product [Psylliodes chrysocephalus]|uniref:Cytochrome P450 n=1 Tax=Psylliodes chrysocephalus TaxID=3402493 RepID=A0A9P0D9Y2_9CUCU|nr:unnamed protein product [Psylliodes chrysocephala]
MNFVTLVYIFLSLVGIIFFYIKWKQSYWSRRGVDYIEPDFFFGNTTAITKRTKHRSKVFESFYRHFKSKGQKFGGVYDFLKPVFIVTDLELIRNILQRDFSHFVNHVGFINEDADPITGHLFNLKNDKWKNIRSKLTPTFTTVKIKMMFDTMTQCIKGLEKILDQNAALNDPVDIKKYMLLFTSDIITSVAFGLDVDSLKNPKNDFRKHFANVFKPSFKSLVKKFISENLPRWFLVAVKFRMTRKTAEDFFVKVVKDIVEHREKHSVYRKDFMHLLIQIKNTGETTDNENLNSNSTIKHLSYGEMAAQAIAFYVAGFETSSTTVCFALFELALHSDIQNRLREEIQSVMKKHNNQITYDGIMEMEYLDLVFKESLRKTSTASAISRECNKEYSIPGTDVVIEQGTEILIPIHGLHNDPEHFPEPDKFDPERFNEENRKKIPPFAYLPFGEGPRNCIGLRFGKIQSKVGIVAIISRYKVTLNAKTQQPIKYASNRVPTIEGGMWLNLEKLSN